MAGSVERPTRPARSRPRRIARLIGWNVLLLFVLLALAASGAELYLRLTTPFRGSVAPRVLAEGVGMIRVPNAEIRHTNGSDFWQVSRANSLGFVDREPPSPERAAESCHVTLLGDSFVEALEVPIAEKAQVRLEELAAREAPALDVTASAFGHADTGQVNQLPFYDAYARALSPNVLVLVAVYNDLMDNSLALKSWFRGFHPDSPPHLYAYRGGGGEMVFAPPAASPQELRAGAARSLSPPPFRTRVERKAREWSYLADWLWASYEDWRSGPPEGQRRARAERLSRIPDHEGFTQGWDPREHLTVWELLRLFREERPPPVVRDALDVTRFALEQFRERAARDGAVLVILDTHTFHAWPRLRDHLHVLAAGVGDGIPVISQEEHIVATGGDIADGHWAHDGHWNATGHQWAAEAIWEWLKQNPEVCG